MKNNTLKDKAYQYIKEQIISCHFPPSTYLVEAELMEVIGASRTPIREALNKLEQENLVRILPKRGVMVAEIGLGEIEKIYETRQLIEPYLIRQYAHRVSVEELEQHLARAKSPEGALGDYQADNQLHQLLISASGNEYLVETVNRTQVQNQRIRVLSGVKNGSRLLETQQEHRVILEHLLAMEWEAAATAMEQHLESSKQAALVAML